MLLVLSHDRMASIKNKNELWGSLYMQTFHQHKILINEQQVNDLNPLFEHVFN